MDDWPTNTLAYLRHDNKLLQKEIERLRAIIAEFAACGRTNTCANLGSDACINDCGHGRDHYIEGQPAPNASHPNAVGASKRELAISPSRDGGPEMLDGVLRGTYIHGRGSGDGKAGEIPDLTGKVAIDDYLNDDEGGDE